MNRGATAWELGRNRGSTNEVPLGAFRRRVRGSVARATARGAQTTSGLGQTKYHTGPFAEECECGHGYAAEHGMEESVVRRARHRGAELRVDGHLERARGRDQHGQHAPGAEARPIEEPHGARHDEEREHGRGDAAERGREVVVRQA